MKAARIWKITLGIFLSLMTTLSLAKGLGGKGVSINPDSRSQSEMVYKVGEKATLSGELCFSNFKNNSSNTKCSRVLNPNIQMKAYFPDATHEVTETLNLQATSGASIFDSFKNFSKKIGDKFGKVGSIIISNVLIGPVGTLTAINFSGQFSEKDKRIYNFIAAVAFNVGLGADITVINLTLALSEPGNFMDNFSYETFGSLGTEGAKSFSPFFKELIKENAIRYAYVFYRFDKNDDTVNRRTDRVCRWFTFNKCPL